MLFDPCVSDWNEDNETLYAIDVFERENERQKLGKCREVRESWL